MAPEEYKLRTDIKLKPISIGLLMVITSLLSIFITYTYARSITLLYGGIEIALALICYFFIFKDLKAPDHWITIITASLMVIALINGIIYGDLKSVLLLSISIVLPLAISVMPIQQNDGNEQFKWGFLAGLALILLQSASLFFGEINSNTFGFYCYMAVSIGFVWYKQAKNRVIPLLLIAVGAYLSAMTGSRNVAIVILLMLIILLLPDGFWKKKTVFRTIYILALFYTIFAADIMEWIFEQEKLSAFISKYTTSVSDKQWGMDTRIYFFKEIEYKISRMGWYNKLFGEGILNHHGHNMFYQAVFIYGYLGTALIYAMYIRIFEMAYKLIKKNNDKIVIGIFVALIGVFLLNGADLFLIGSETCAIIPQVLMGIIMLRYRNMMKKESHTTMVEV